MPSVMMSREEVAAFLERQFPDFHSGEVRFAVEEVRSRFVRIRHELGARVEGALTERVMMAVADLAFRAALVATLGPTAVPSPTSLSFNFLGKPRATALVGECRLVKVGKRLAIGEVALWGEGETGLACHVTGTYSIPRRQSA